MSMLINNIWTPANQLIQCKESACRRIWNQIKVQIEEGKLRTIKHVVEALKPYPEQEMINRVVVSVLIRQKRFKDAVQILRRYPVELENDMTSLLHEAAEFDSLIVTKALLKKGADFLYADARDNIPIDFAKDESNVFDLLLEKMITHNIFFSQLRNLKINDSPIAYDDADYTIRYAMKIRPGETVLRERIPDTDFQITCINGLTYLFAGNNPFARINFEEKSLTPIAAPKEVGLETTQAA